MAVLAVVIGSLALGGVNEIDLAQAEVKSTAPCNTPTSQTALLQSEMNNVQSGGGGIYRLPPCSVSFAGVLTVPSKVALRGEGPPSSQLWALDASAQLRFGTSPANADLGQAHGDLRIHGAGRSSRLVSIMGQGKGAWENMYITGFVTDGLYLQSLQNSTFTNVWINGLDTADNGLTIDLSSSGNSFRNFDVSGLDRYNVRVVQSGPSPQPYATPAPADNTCYRCQIENLGSVGPTAYVYVTAALGRGFVLVDSFVGGKAPQGSGLIHVNRGGGFEAGVTLLNSTVQANDQPRQGTGIYLSGPNYPTASLLGMSRLSNLAVGINLSVPSRVEDDGTQIVANTPVVGVTSQAPLPSRVLYR